MKKAFVGFVIGMLAVSAPAADEYWVASDVADRKTCASEKCGVLGQMYFRSKASVEEVKGTWGRVTRYYDANCVSGVSKYVKSGNAKCVKENGISNSQVAEWVEMRHLSKSRPADPAAGATGTAALIGGSDDYKNHKEVFVKVTDDLIAKGECSKKDFKEWGGWMRSTSYKNAPVYFMYCSGSSPSNKVYLNAATGKTFRE